MFGFIKKLFSNNHEEVKQYLQNGAVIVDVRSPAEYKSGHIKGAVNIPLNQLGNNIAPLAKQNKPIITCCASGRRSGIAAKQLVNKDVEAINGGSWTTVQQIINQL